jgi:DNA-binding transcriptional LysR family regulator
MMVPVNDMLLFVDVVKSKSFSVAAKKHEISPSAVSKRIAHLEKELGVRLLNRTTRKLALTETGYTLFSYCEKIYLELQKAYTDVLDTHNKPVGTLLISSPTNFSNLILAPIIAKFVVLYPEINIKVIINDTRKIPPVGEYDIAIRSGLLEDSSAITRRLTTIKFVICASPLYLKKHSVLKHPNDLENHNCIDYNYRQEGKIWSFFKDKDAFDVPVKGSISSNNALFIKNVAINGVGIACLPSFMVNVELKEETLVQVLTNYHTLEMPVSIIYPYINKTMPKKIKLFIDFLFEHTKSNL